MKSLIVLIVSFQATVLFSQLKYPATKTVDSSDTYFGVNYPDPYRWLEKMKEPEVESWFKEQADFSENIINKISGRTELIDEWNRLEKLKTAVYFDRFICGERIFYQKTEAGESARKFYYKENASGKEQLLFDPTKSISEKTVTIQSAIPSHDGKKVLISYAQGGSEISTIKVIDVETKAILKENIYPCLSGSIFWCCDNKAFIYTSISTGDNTNPDFLKNNKVKIHKVGEDSKNDLDFFSNEAYPELNIKPYNYPNGELTELAEDYLFSSIGNDDGLNIYYVASVKQQYSKHIEWRNLSKAEDKLLNGIDFRGDTVYAISNKNAPNYKLIATSISNPNWEKAEIIADEKKDLVLDEFLFCKDFVLLTYTNGINKRLFKYEFTTKKTSEIKLPYNGNVYTNCLDRKTNTCYVYITSWNKPYTEFKVDLKTNNFSASDFNVPAEYPAEYKNIEVEEVEVKGHDGTMIPLSIIYKKGTKKNGSNFCLMESYGSYGYSMLPSFNTFWNSLVVKGIVLAIPHVRGGGEKGDAWHKGGLKTTKPNTWKDFNSCADYLIKNGYTSAKKITASSGSAGGILIGRAITERPDLYGAAISTSGVLNTLRSEKMPNGDNLSFEFGKTQDSVECKALFEMDGLAHLTKNVNYPAVLCFTGINDPRVSSWQSAKFVAAMQNLNPSGKPALLMVNYNNGHFSNKDDLANHWAFALWQCGHPDFKLK